MFSVTIGCFDRYRWFAKYPQLAQAFVEELKRTAGTRCSEVFAWCVMPDHVHLLVRDDDVVELVRLLKGRLTPVARRIEAGRCLWQRSFYDHGLRLEKDLLRAARYIWENPIRANLVAEADAYPCSGSLIWRHWSDYDLSSSDSVTTQYVGE